MDSAPVILSTATGFVVSPVRSATPEAVAVPIARVGYAVRTDVEETACLVVVWVRPAMRRVGSVRVARPTVWVGYAVRTDVGEAACLAVLWARPVMRRVGCVRDVHRIVMSVSVALTDVGRVVVIV